MQVDARGNLLIAADGAGVSVQDGASSVRALSAMRHFGGVLRIPRAGRAALDESTLYGVGGARLVRVERDDNVTALAAPMLAQLAGASPFASGTRVWFGDGEAGAPFAVAPSCVLQSMDLISNGRWYPAMLMDASGSSVGVFQVAMGFSPTGAVIELETGTSTAIHCVVLE